MKIKKAEGISAIFMILIGVLVFLGLLKLFGGTRSILNVIFGE